MSTQLAGAVREPAPVDARRRQAEALETSGWGERFTFVQPANPCFWLYLALTGIGAVHLVSFFGPTAEFSPEALAVGAVLVGLCGAAWWLWFRHIDRFERQPVGLELAAVVWGGIAATFAFALTANNAAHEIYAKLFGQEWVVAWGPGLTAPITEEGAKLCGFLLLMGLAPRLIRTANDGLILGAFIGLGLGLVEDLLYAANSTAEAFGSDPVGSAVHMSFTRIAASFVSHPLYTALVCSGVVYLIGTAAQPRRIGRGIALVLAGVGLHFLWDANGALGDLLGGGVVGFVILVATFPLAFVVLSRAFRSAAPREHQFVRDVLAPEVEAGTVAAEEIEAAVDGDARKAFEASAPDRHARKARTHLRRAVLDLTHEVAIARGADTDAVQHARAEVARLRAGRTEQLTPVEHAWRRP